MNTPTTTSNGAWVAKYSVQILITLVGVLAALAWGDLRADMARIDSEGTRNGIARMAVMESQMLEMQRQNNQILAEIRELRREVQRGP